MDELPSTLDGAPEEEAQVGMFEEVLIKEDAVLIGEPEEPSSSVSVSEVPPVDPASASPAAAAAAAAPPPTPRRRLARARAPPVRNGPQAAPTQSRAAVNGVGRGAGGHTEDELWRTWCRLGSLPLSDLEADAQRTAAAEEVASQLRAALAAADQRTLDKRRQLEAGLRELELRRDQLRRLRKEVQARRRQLTAAVQARRQSEAAASPAEAEENSAAAGAAAAPEADASAAAARGRGRGNRARARGRARGNRGRRGAWRLFPAPEPWPWEADDTDSSESEPEPDPDPLAISSLLVEEEASGASLCSECGLVLASPLQLPRHQREAHPELCSEPGPPSPVSLMCENCGELCVDEYALHAHTCRTD